MRLFRIIIVDIHMSTLVLEERCCYCKIEKQDDGAAECPVLVPWGHKTTMPV
jgi:hypothetical protein